MVVDSFDSVSYECRRSQRAKIAIDQFVYDYGLRKHVHNYKGHSIWVLGDQEGGDIPVELANRYLQEQLSTDGQHFSLQCYIVAQGLCDVGFFDGRLHETSGESTFIGLGPHCINYAKVEASNLFIAVDFTTVDNIDRGQENFNLLAITAGNMDQLLDRVSRLYDGQWIVKD